MKDKKFLLGFFLGGLMFASGVLASNYMSSDIAYTPSDSNWKVSNVAEAINSIELSKTSDNYSTEERVVGTWIDGKPLYQKTFTGALDSTTETTIVNDSTIELKDSAGYLVYSSGSLFTLNITDSSDYILYIEQLQNKSIVLVRRKFGTDGNYFVTLQYTKTTDNSSNS